MLKLYTMPRLEIYFFTVLLFTFNLRSCTVNRLPLGKLGGIF